MTALPLSTILARHRPAPNARGEGIRTAKAFRATTTELYVAKILEELEGEIEAALSRPVQSGGR